MLAILGELAARHARHLDQAIQASALALDEVKRPSGIRIPRCAYLHPPLLRNLPLRIWESIEVFDEMDRWDSLVRQFEEMVNGFQDESVFQPHDPDVSPKHQSRNLHGSQHSTRHLLADQAVR